MRKLATIRKIDEIRPIENADAIECAVVGGWAVVVKKDEFKVGDLAVYLEIDSWVPYDLAPFLCKGKEPREYEGVKGERLRTVKLRGQLSQGLLLPLASLYGVLRGLNDHFDGQDVTENLGILKYEKPIPAQLSGMARGNFPSAIPKTDQERVQNLKKELEKWSKQNLQFEVTEKLEGSSCTMYLDFDGVFHVCSRNLDLQETEGNSFWEVARKYDVENRMREAGMFGYAIQGELVGEGVQGNIYKLWGRDFYVFDIYSEYEKTYLTHGERVTRCSQLGLKHTPVIHNTVGLFGVSIEVILTAAEGKSQLYDTEREGIVFKCLTDPSISFKAISNRYLIKQKD